MGQTKILLVEDEAFLRDVYVDTLTPEGYSIEVAKDGEEALDKLKNNDWDLVLFDIMLPKLSAFDILQKLNTDPTYNKEKNKKILFLSNLDGEADIKKALSLGGEGYLIKSQITPGDLAREVRMYLSKKELNVTTSPAVEPQQG